MILLVDSPLLHSQLLPFTYLRNAADIWIGASTIREKWEALTQQPVAVAGPLDPEALSGLDHQSLIVSGGVLPNEELIQACLALEEKQVLTGENNKWLAVRGPVSTLKELGQLVTSYNKIPFQQEYLAIEHPWEIFRLNGQALRMDIPRIIGTRKSEPLHDAHTICYRKENIFISKQVTIRAAILDAENGPIYLDEGVHIQPGAVILGPIYIGKNSVVSLGAKIKGDTTIGPSCKVGGEVTNSVLFGYSNKSHDGYLGNSVLAEWCNLGADTNSSNLKNNYDFVKVWSYAAERFVKTGLQFCGLLMGDHSKAGINTMFNTGTTVGVGANVFGAGFPRTFIPSFSWGGPQGYHTFQMSKMLEMAERVMERRGRQMDDEMRTHLERVFKETARFRTWENQSNA